MKERPPKPRRKRRGIRGTPSAITPPPKTKSRFVWEDDDIEFVDTLVVPESTKRAPMLLTTEGGFKSKRLSGKLVARIIGEVDTGFGNSFCRLELSDMDYIQALHGLNGWHLEWRASNFRDRCGYAHFRASHKGGSKRRRLLRKSDAFVSSGIERDLLSAADVLLCFLAFLRSESRPAGFEWRRLSI